MDEHDKARITLQSPAGIGGRAHAMRGACPLHFALRPGSCRTGWPAMSIAKIEGAPAGARWTVRIALFALVMLIVAVLMHRFLGMRTPVLLATIQVALASAAVALVLGIGAGVRIWRHGGAGTARVLLGLTVASGLLAWPLAYMPTMKRLPKINDVVTSPAAPPQFEALSPLRQPPANIATYPAGRFYPLQKAAYPDLDTMVINRAVDETYDLVVEAVRRQKLNLVREQPPTAENGDTGTLEAVDRTLIIGFYDDVAIRVAGGSTQSVVDIRSASRYGQHDFGTNAAQIEKFLADLDKALIGIAGEG